MSSCWLILTLVCFFDKVNQIILQPVVKFNFIKQYFYRKVIISIGDSQFQKELLIDLTIQYNIIFDKETNNFCSNTMKTVHYQMIIPYNSVILRGSEIEDSFYFNSITNIQYNAYIEVGFFSVLLNHR